MNAFVNKVARAMSQTVIVSVFLILGAALGMSATSGRASAVVVADLNVCLELSGSAPEFIECINDLKARIDLYGVWD